MPVPKTPDPMHLDEDAPAVKVEAQSAIPTPETVASVDTSSGGVHALNCRPGHPFFLVHYARGPGNWYIGEVDGAPVLCPQVQRAYKIPGVGGVRTVPDGTPKHADPAVDTRTAKMVEKIRAKGGRALVLSRTTRNHDLLAEYLVKYPTSWLPPGMGKAETGLMFLERWTIPRPDSDLNPRKVGSGSLKCRVDTVMRDRYLAGLVERGEVDPAPGYVLDHLRERQETRVWRRIHESQPGFLASHGVGSFAALVDASDEVLAALGGHYEAPVRAYRATIAALGVISA